MGPGKSQRVVIKTRYRLSGVTLGCTAGRQHRRSTVIRRSDLYMTASTYRPATWQSLPSDRQRATRLARDDLALPTQSKRMQLRNLHGNYRRVWRCASPCLAGHFIGYRESPMFATHRGQAQPLADTSKTKQVVVACAYNLPLSSSIRASAVDICRPAWITVPTARSGPVVCEAERTMLTLSSAVV